MVPEPEEPSLWDQTKDILSNAITAPNIARLGGSVGGGVLGGAIGGALAGSAVAPGPGTLGGAAIGGILGGIGGSAGGEALAQRLEGRDEVDLGEVALAGALGAIPAGPAAAAAGRITATGAKGLLMRGALHGVEGASQGVLDTLGSTAYREGRLPTAEELKMGALAGGVIGAPLGGGLDALARSVTPRPGSLEAQVRGELPGGSRLDVPDYSQEFTPQAPPPRVEFTDEPLMRRAWEQREQTAPRPDQDFAGLDPEIARILGGEMVPEGTGVRFGGVSPERGQQVIPDAPQDVYSQLPPGVRSFYNEMVGPRQGDKAYRDNVNSKFKTPDEAIAEFQRQEAITKAGNERRRAEAEAKFERQRQAYREMRGADTSTSRGQEPVVDESLNDLPDNRPVEDVPFSVRAAEPLPFGTPEDMESLRSLGWTQKDITAMTPSDRVNILEHGISAADDPRPPAEANDSPDLDPEYAAHIDTIKKTHGWDDAEYAKAREISEAWDENDQFIPREKRTLQPRPFDPEEFRTSKLDELNAENPTGPKGYAKIGSRGGFEHYVHRDQSGKISAYVQGVQDRDGKFYITEWAGSGPEAGLVIRQMARENPDFVVPRDGLSEHSARALNALMERPGKMGNALRDSLWPIDAEPRRADIGAQNASQATPGYPSRGLGQSDGRGGNPAGDVVQRADPGRAEADTAARTPEAPEVGFKASSPDAKTDAATLRNQIASQRVRDAETRTVPAGRFSIATPHKEFDAVAKEAARDSVRLIEAAARMTQEMARRAGVKVEFAGLTWDGYANGFFLPDSSKVRWNEAAAYERAVKVADRAERLGKTKGKPRDVLIAEGIARHGWATMAHEVLHSKHADHGPKHDEAIRKLIRFMAGQRKELRGSIVDSLLSRGENGRRGLDSVQSRFARIQDGWRQLEQATESAIAQRLRGVDGDVRGPDLGRNPSDGGVRFGADQGDRAVPSDGGVRGVEPAGSDVRGPRGRGERAEPVGGRYADDSDAFIHYGQVGDTRVHRNIPQRLIELPIDDPRIKYGEMGALDPDDFNPAAGKRAKLWTQGDERRTRSYASRKTEIPPIDLRRKGDNFRIEDGHHRLEAARMRGDKTIKAWVDEPEVESRMMPRKGPGDNTPANPDQTPGGGINPSTVSKAVLSRMNSRLKAMGFDMRGTEDVRRAMVRNLGTDGQFWNKDWKEAYEFATGSATRQKAKAKTLKEATPHVNWEAVNRLGRTTNPRQAGYVNPDGSLMDLGGGGSGGRGHDHRIVGGTAGMQELQGAGYIRWMPESNGLDIGKEPTPQQYGRIRDLAARAKGEVILDLQDGPREFDTRNEWYGDAPRKTYLELPAGTSPEKVVGLIKRFYAGEDVGSGTRFSERRDSGAQNVGTSERSADVSVSPRNPSETPNSPKFSTRPVPTIKPIPPKGPGKTLEFTPKDTPSKDSGRVAAEAGKQEGGDPTGKPSKRYVNLDRISTDKDVKAMEARVEEALKTDLKKARGYRSWDEARDKALASGLTREDFERLVREKGAVTDYHIEAGRILREEAFKDMRSSLLAFKEAEAAGKKTEDLEDAYEQAATRAAGILYATTRAGAEAGRALAIHRKMSEGLTTNERFVRRAMKERPGISEGFVKRVLQTPETDHKALADLVRAEFKPGMRSKLYEYWINGLLSGPPTHLANITGNTITQLLRIAEKGVAGGIDAARVAAFGGSRDRFVGEAYADVMSLKEGLRKGLHAFKEDWSDEFRAKDDQKIEHTAGAIPGKAGRVIRTPTRLLGAMDEAFKAMAATRESRSLAYRKARQEGHRGEMLNKRIEDILGNLEKHPDILSGMQKEKEYQTFTKKLGKFGTTLTALREADPTGLSKVIVPFIRTPLNITKYTLERTPLNFIRLADMFGPQVYAKRGDAKLAEELAKPLLGTMMGMGFAMMAQEGLLTGGGPSDYKENEAKRATGWQPYSIKVGDQYLSYKRLEPISSILGFAADLVEAKDEDTQADLVNKIIGSATENLTDKSFIKGAADVALLWSDPKRYASQWAKSMEGSVVPAIVGRAAQAIDPTIRETSATDGSAIAARIPGLSMALEPKRRGSGDAAERDGGSALERFASPFTRSTEKGTEADLERLFVAVDAVPSKPSRTITIPGTGKKVELTDDEYKVFLKADQEATARLRRQVNSLKRGNPESAKRLIEDAYRDAHRRARNRVLPRVAYRVRQQRTV